MTALISFTQLALLLFPAQVDLDAVVKEVQRQAQAAADAVVAEEFETLADLTYPKVVEQMGGKAKMVEILKSAFKRMKAQNMMILASTADAPVKIYRAGAVLMTVVPVKIEMGTPDGKLTLRSFLVGVSVDKGEKWTFIDGNIGEEKIREILPNMPREMKFPEMRKPMREKAPK